LTDAKLPSVEAGAQKALTAIPTLLAGGSLRLDAGLLGVDQICSPVQMILDDEFLGALACFTHEFEITEDSIGLDTILETGPGGHYFDKVHTARRFRGEHWMPRFWSSARLEPWLQGGCQLDEDKARQFALDVKGRPAEPPRMSESLERTVLEIIARAGQALL
jgi:trimethylamine--corrinoid protein Co-methyltransferase